MSISFRRVTKIYHTSFLRKKVEAVIDMSLNIDKGEIFGIIGPNGAGKSTILKMLMGFIRPSEGEISVLGCSPENPETKRQIGYLPENPYYYDHLSAEELMRFSARTSGMKHRETERKIDELLQVMSLQHARKRKLRGYSKGMTQRAGICFALVHDPELIILDEPMSGLDPIGRKDVVDLVLDLKDRGKTVLFCSHILNDVERLCDRMAIMDKGRLRKVMDKKDMIEFSRTMSFVCTGLKKDLHDSLQNQGVSIEKTNIGHLIRCPNSKVNDVIKQLTENRVNISSMDSCAETLESIFFEAIQGEV